MNNQFLERRGSIKRSREEVPQTFSLSNGNNDQHDTKERPLKRNNSPRNSFTMYSSSPSTPKKSSRHLIGRKNKILTSFKNAFTSSKSSTFHSPISYNDDEISPNSSGPSSPLSSCCSEIVSPNSNFFTPPTPNGETNSIFDFNKKESVCKNLQFNQQQSSSSFEFDDSMNEKLLELSLKSPEPIIQLQEKKLSHQIFHIPEIVSKIISYVDSEPLLPHEVSPIRRRPLSYQHALLIYKDESKARNVWKEACESSLQNNGNPPTTTTTTTTTTSTTTSTIITSKNSNNLYNCLLVCKLWYRITLEVASNKLFFSNERRWSSFVEKTTRIKPTRSISNTSLFIMHKLTRANQQDLEIIAPSISGNLKWIEMYICPKILPPPIMLTGSKLEKLVMPGSKVVNDSFLNLVSNYCPNLKTLDLRACELISDEGIISIAENCPQLVNLNLGRHTNGGLITDLSLNSIAKNTKIETLGMAGCSITDRGIWEIAYHCSDSLSRLSLNNCMMLTNNSLPRIIKDGFLSKLVVLEIRNILNITDFKPLINFKKMNEINGNLILIEGCEILEYRMREEEWKYEMKKSAKILNDVLYWANNDNDGDVSHSELMKLYKA